MTSNLDRILFDVWVKKAVSGLLLMLAGLVSSLVSNTFAVRAALDGYHAFVTIYLGFAYFGWAITFVGSVYIAIYAYKIVRFKWRLLHARI